MPRTMLSAQHTLLSSGLACHWAAGKGTRARSKVEASTHRCSTIWSVLQPTQRRRRTAVKVSTWCLPSAALLQARVSVVAAKEHRLSNEAPACASVEGNGEQSRS